MIDQDVRDFLERMAAEEPVPFIDAEPLARRARGRAVRTVIVGAVGVAATIAVLFGGVSLLADGSPSRPATDPTPTVWSPVRDPGASSVLARSLRDPRDAPVGWVDVKRLGVSGGKPSWFIELAAKPPLAADLEPGRLIAYGLVFDTTGDGVADYVMGIENADRGVGIEDDPEDFRVWVTDLATGETDEQIGGPYGLPFEFIHPDEASRGDDNPPHMTFWFLWDSAPPDLDPKTVRFYAWASETVDGEVVAWDYAPDTGWMTRP